MPRRWGSVERHPGKAYIRMGLVLGTGKGRDLKRAPLAASTRRDPRAAAAWFKDSEGNILALIQTL
jgi:hypothetical protein